MLKFIGALLLLLVVASSAFTTQKQFATKLRSSPALFALQTDASKKEVFKAGFFANCDDEAAILASKKIRSVKDLGWKGPAKRRGATRPRHWSFGGTTEKPVQEKPNYDESAANCVEKWLPLQDFYAIVKDETAVADTIFVALAGGGAFVERDVAEEVIAKWRPSGGKFDEAAFLRTVKEGRNKFALGWLVFLGFLGFAGAGIIFPTNPLQLALVDVLESALHNEDKLTELANIKAGLL